MNLLPVYTGTYMSSLANYVATYFPIFLLGAIFGKVMDSSGAAQTIANAIAKKLGKEKAIIAVVLSCAILTYGGVSLFVVAFAKIALIDGLMPEKKRPTPNWQAAKTVSVLGSD